MKKIIVNSGIVLFFPFFGMAADECTKDWALEGQMKSKSYVYGLGLSSKNNPQEAVAEAKAAAMKEVGTQLQSSVQSESKLEETQDGSSFSAQLAVKSDLKDLTGMKIVKEGKNLSSKITSCVVVKFDAGSAYAEAEGKMKVLEKAIEDAVAAAKKKQYVEVLKKRISAKKTIQAAQSDIVRADLLRTYINADDESWFEKVKSKEIEMDKVAEQAKESIIFVLPEGTQYEGTLAEVESKLSGSGFEVSRTTNASKPVRVLLELKVIGAPRKTKTALGITYISKIMVSLKEGTKSLATNKGANVTGTGSNEDDALANIDRQLLVHVMEVLNEGLPGLITEE